MYEQYIGGEGAQRIGGAIQSTLRDIKSALGVFITLQCYKDAVGGLS